MTTYNTFKSNDHYRKAEEYTLYAFNVNDYKPT